MSARLRQLRTVVLLALGVIGAVSGVWAARRAGAPAHPPRAPLTARPVRANAPEPASARTESAPMSLPDVVASAVARNAFRPQRAPAATRYHVSVPGEPSAPAPPPAPVRPPVPAMRVVGLVAVGGGKGMAALEVAGAPPRLLSVGDSIAGFRLLSVSATQARLARPDTTLVLLLQGPNP